MYKPLNETQTKKFYSYLLGWRRDLYKPKIESGLVCLDRWCTGYCWINECGDLVWELKTQE